MQHIFIINPTAGKVDASVALIPQIHAAASRAGLHPTIEVTRRARQARDLAAQYAAGGEEVYLYACGGDGGKRGYAFFHCKSLPEHAKIAAYTHIHDILYNIRCILSTVFLNI